jgi:hypothetical protein
MASSGRLGNMLVGNMLGDLVRQLEMARQAVGPRFLPDNYVDALGRLQTEDDIRRLEADPAHPLWWFLPAILFAVQGSHAAVERVLTLPPSREGLVMIPPQFLKIAGELAQELGDFGLTVRQGCRRFTRALVGLLYGGYPWFEAYLRLNDSLGSFTQPCGYLIVKSTSGDTADRLLQFKEGRRCRSGMEIRQPYPDLAYPGILRPFHTPARVENIRHIRAVEVA